jgi:WD40 repeat protein
MAQINVAFEILIDPVRRSEYDASIGHSPHSEPVREPQDSSHPNSVSARVAARHLHHRTPVYAITHDRRSGRLITSSFDNEIIWWGPGAAEPENRRKLEGGVVSTIQTAPKGLLIAAGSTEQSLTCWRVADGKPRSWRKTPKEWIVCLSPSPDGQSLALGHVSSAIRVVATDTGQPKWSASSHSESVTALSWSKDGKYLATGSGDASVKIWDGATGKELHTIDRIRSSVTTIAFSADGRYLAVGAVDLSIRVFSLQDMLLRQTFFGHTKPIEGLAFHPRNWLLGSVSRDGSVGLWNVKHGIGHGRIEASHQPISAISFSPDGSQMITGGLDKVLRIWDLKLPSRV